ncbi:MAG: PH domain-containing protein [Planctomycetota bacterium]
MWDDAESQIKRELSSGEQLLWYGRPQLGIQLRASDALLIPASLLWGGFAIFWEATAVMRGAPVFFVLWGIPFVLVGLHLIVGRFFVDAKQRSRTYYGVTDERVIIVSGLFRRSVKSLRIDTLTDVALEEKADGSGTITLGPTSPWNHWFGGSNWPGTHPLTVSSFEMIDNAREVDGIIRESQRGTRP